MRLFDLLKKKEPYEGKDIVFANNFLIVGEQYECRKNPKKKRLDVLKKVDLHSKVRLEKYTYQGKPAFMIIDEKSGLDLGVLSAGAASWVADNFMKGDVSLKLTDKYKDSYHVDVVIYR